MTTLFVNACAREESRTLSLCHAYLEGNPAVEEVRLFERNLVPFDWKMVEERVALIEKADWGDSMFDLAKQFAAADEIVIGAPYWDLSFPAVLKVYIEHVTVNGIVFHYTEEGRPEGLCKAKRLVYITTSGGPCSFANYGFEYLQGIAHMFGIPETHFISAELLDVIGQDVDAIMNDALTRVRDLKETLPSCKLRWQTIRSFVISLDAAGLRRIHRHGLEAMLHVGVVVVLVEELFERGVRRVPRFAQVPAIDRLHGEHHIHHHEYEAHNGKRIAQLPRNLVDHPKQDRQQELHPHHTEYAPEAHEHEVRAAIDRKERSRIIPGHNSECTLHDPADRELERTTDQR